MESSGRSSSLSLPSLPRKVRDEIYRILLVVPHPLYIFTQQLHGEASATLYGSHRFVLVDTTPGPQGQADLLQSFLGLIGSVNASHLSHMCINFPLLVVTPPEPEPEKRNTGCHSPSHHQAGEEEVHAGDNTTPLRGEPEPEEDAGDLLRGLTLLRIKCRNLTTLDMYVHSQSSRGLRVMASWQPECAVREALLREVDAQLRAIPSLCTIRVRLYDGPLAPEVMEWMQSFGWDVSPGR
ncbi:hypothetical protein B0T19DRAFT_457530 [Cercophora scortea]|uniref:Uncharacterized protein n=1 Tax=Cercophora scortea TaxID=314031 RepID=A0AAE0IX90_9PEZI|nr:hypothetical protein B0T19DRAFT_457530 [Cercophora scortea]